MVPVEWHDATLADLDAHDEWRELRGLDPIADEIIDAINAAFARGYIYPKRRCQVRGEPLPVYQTLVEVRSKPFIIYFIDREQRPLIRRILHPRRDTSRVEV